MNKLYMVEGWSIAMVNGTNIVQLGQMANEYLDTSHSEGLKFYEVIQRTCDYVGKGLYIGKTKQFAFRFVEVDSTPKDYNEVENESEN